MDFADQICTLSAQVAERRNNVQTEEATKNALILPFIAALGYDIFDPSQVVPEFTADIGERKGEKVDYAIMKDGKPILLFECKTASAKLNADNATQLQRYFHGVADAKFGILTNGIKYLFFTDLDRENVLDGKPFLDVDILDVGDGITEQLKKFTHSAFDAQHISSIAGDLKYTRELILLLDTEFTSPSESFIRYLASQVYDGRLTQNKMDGFVPVVKKACARFINDRLTNTLDRAKAIQEDDESTTTPEEAVLSAEESTNNSRIVTTEEEFQGFYIIKAILAGIIEADRVVMRDKLSYCGILLDDNNRKPICRLHFNSSTKKQLGLFNADKAEEKESITSVDEIYKFAERILAAVRRYDGADSAKPQS